MGDRTTVSTRPHSLTSQSEVLGARVKLGGGSKMAATPSEDLVYGYLVFHKGLIRKTPIVFSSKFDPTVSRDY